jgi:hypothetical protein
MKRILTAALAIALLSGGAVLADNKAPKKASHMKPKIALMIEGKVTKEVLPTKEKVVPGVGTDYTFEWSGGQGDIMITGGGE